MSYLRVLGVEQEGQRAYERSIQFLSPNHYCYGKAISITCYECVFLALGIQYAMRKRHIVISDLPVSATFSHIVS